MRVEHAPDGFRFDEYARTIRTGAASPNGGPFVLPPELAEGLPAEWIDYQQGAYLFWHKDLPGASAAWDHLLARPLAERRYRSVWAAYLLARIDDQPDEPTADRAGRYQRVRALRAEGCRDVFDMASDAFGWEGRLALDKQDLPSALRLYYLQGISSAGLSDPMASSLRTVAEEALKDGPASEPVAAAAPAPFLRRVVTHYQACRRRFADQEPGPPDDPPAENKLAELEKGWLTLLTKENVNAVREATPIAWSAYQQGDYASAAAWLAKAPDTDGLAWWLRAKLALRDVHPDAAAKCFDQAVRAFPVEIRATDNCLDSTTNLAADGAEFRANQFHADLGIINLSRHDYAQALSALLRSGFWRDAAYVAERVMNTDELRAYVRGNFPAAPPAASPAPDAYPEAAAPANVQTIQSEISARTAALIPPPTPCATCSHAVSRATAGTPRPARTIPRRCGRNSTPTSPRSGVPPRSSVGWAWSFSARRMTRTGSSWTGNMTKITTARYASGCRTPPRKETACRPHRTTCRR